MSFCGIAIGHATNEEHHSGCTVFLCPDGTVGSADARGASPGTRELILMQPGKRIQFVNAVVLSGGSAFGLAAADGVMRYLGERNIGHITPMRPIPIVPAAIIYDLSFNHGVFAPDAEMGYQACLNAHQDERAQGNVGVGAGATAGKWGGFEGAMKGGFGLASAVEGDLQVCAAAVVNSIGDVVHEDGSVLAGARIGAGGPTGFRWRVEEDPYRHFAGDPLASIGAHTTLVVVATNAALDKAACHRLAERAHDGMALAVRPVHTNHDGDTAFALATGQVPVASLDDVANIAVPVVAEAIRNGVRFASSVGNIVGLAD